MSKLDDKKEHLINDLTPILNSELELFEHMISGFSKNYILTTFSDHQHCTYIINTDKTTFNTYVSNIFGQEEENNKHCIL